MDFRITKGDLKNNAEDLKTVLMQSADAVRNTKHGSDDYYDALYSFQKARERFIDDQGMDAYKKLVPAYPQGYEEKKESSKLDYARDLTSPLTLEEMRAINDEVGKYSAANKWSIPAADMRKFVSDWKEALKEKDVKTKAKKLYRIYSTLEDSNWHDENRHLLDGDFDYFNDTYFSNMYGE